MARRHFPPLGFLCASAFASLTRSGRASTWSCAPRPSRRSPCACACACAPPPAWRRGSSSGTARRPRAPGARGRRSGCPRRRRLGRCGDEADSFRFEHVVAGELHHEVALGRLHDRRGLLDRPAGHAGEGAGASRANESARPPVGAAVKRLSGAAAGGDSARCKPSALRPQVGAGAWPATPRRTPVKLDSAALAYLACQHRQSVASPRSCDPRIARKRPP